MLVYLLNGTICFSEHTGVEDSVRAAQWVDETPYEVNGDTGDTTAIDGPAKGRANANNNV